MLTGALEKLDKLLATIDSRASVRVDSGNTNTPQEEAPPPIETEDEVVIDMRARQSTLEPQDRKSTRLNSSHSGESRMPSSA